MKTLGMIGGTGFPSTIEYYRYINELVNQQLGGLNFAKCILYSFNYGDIDKLNRENNTERLFELILEAIDNIVVSGADGLILCANTIHMFAERLIDLVPVPIIHIADTTADRINSLNIEKVGLLGTKMTMEMDFYRQKLEAKNIQVVIPDDEDREYIHGAIMNEMVKGNFNMEMRNNFLKIMESMKTNGVQGFVLGCTEIPLLIKAHDIDLPIFNTLEIHAEAAVAFMLGYDY